MAARTPGEKAAIKFFAAISSLDFSIIPFLTVFDQQSIQMKRRLINIMTSLIDDMAMRFDLALWKNDEEMLLYIDAKRMQDALRPYSVQD